jgi:hypothetical protein
VIDGISLGPSPTSPVSVRAGWAWQRSARPLVPGSCPRSGGRPQPCGVLGGLCRRSHHKWPRSWPLPLVNCSIGWPAHRRRRLAVFCYVIQPQIPVPNFPYASRRQFWTRHCSPEYKRAGAVGKRGGPDCIRHRPFGIAAPRHGVLVGGHCPGGAGCTCGFRHEITWEEPQASSGASIKLPGQPGNLTNCMAALVRPLDFLLPRAQSDDPPDAQRMQRVATHPSRSFPFLRNGNVGDCASAGDSSATANVAIAKRFISTSTCFAAHRRAAQRAACLILISAP